MREPVLEVRNLSIGIRSRKSELLLAEQVNFSVEKGEIVGLAGESGCGKSLTCRAIMGLLPSGIEILSGEIWFCGLRIENHKKLLSNLRGKQLAMIFQEPMRALHPLKTVGRQISEVFRIHAKLDRGQQRREVLELMEKVGIPQATQRIDQYPHQLSGGLAQRVLIAMAIAMKPALILADEPTTALDVTIQAKILRLLDRLNRETEVSMLLISHDLAMLSQLASRIHVMYCGELVEEGKVPEILRSPKHPYTEALLRSVPRMDLPHQELQPIEGMVPSPQNYPEYCRFYERCSKRRADCLEKKPVWRKEGEGHVRCIRYEG